MMRSLGLVVVLAVALRQAGGAERPAAPAPLDRAGFRERLLEVIEAALKGEGLAASKELIALVTAYRWHAFHVVMENTLNLASVHVDLGDHEKAIELQRPPSRSRSALATSRRSRWSSNNMGLTRTYLGDYMDVLNLELEAELVTLSACETQIGKQTSGEVYQGLVRAFLYAGARNVIASSWQVPDRASAGLLPGVYRALLAGKVTAGEALRRAQVGYLERLEPGRAADPASPHYWGAWTVWGVGAGAGPAPAGDARR